MAVTSATISVTSSSATSIVLAGGVATGGSGTYTYLWLRSIDGGNSWASTAGTTAASYTDSSVSSGMLYAYRLQVTDTGVSPNVVTDSNMVEVMAFTAAPIYTTAQAVDVVGSPVGGYTPFVNAALTATVVNVKQSAGTLGGYHIYNPSAAVTYIQVFNAIAANVTLGTTVATFVIPVPATSSVVVTSSDGVAFPVAMSVAATTTPTGLTAPASAAVASILYI